jgi:membrane protease subunit HflC
MDFALYEGRAQIATETEKLMQAMLDRYGTGIYVQKVTLQNALPPDQVAAAFDDAVKAKQDRERQKNEGQAYANDVVPRARGQASRLLQEADGYNASVTQRADGDASRFRQILVEYAKAPAVTRQRLYLDMMQSVLGNSSKVLIDQKAGNNLLYLPLDQLLKQSAAGAAVAADAARPRRRGRTMKATTPLLALLVAALLVLSQSLYTVDQKQYAIKFQLGEFIDAKTEAGLYLKVPLLQNVKFYDKRILLLETSDPDRVTTSEKTPLKADFIAYWRITDVRKYYQSVTGDEETARRRLAQTIRANLAEEINKRTLHEAISTEREKIMTTTRQKADADAKSIGVEVVDVRLRRVELPDEVLAQVYQRMESERKRVANELRSLGAAESEKIRADADRQREVILADAYKQAQKTKGEGDAKASATYASAYGQNPEFYSFYRSLEAYKTTFRSKGDVIVLDPSAEFFQYLKQPGGGPPASRGK